MLLVGEMRDLESIETTLTIAETGHLVFATLHTNDAAQAVDRVIDVFPGERQSQIRSQLAASMLGVIAQRLLPRVDGGRVAAFEVLLSTPAVRNLISEGKTEQLRNVMVTGQRAACTRSRRRCGSWWSRASSPPRWRRPPAHTPPSSPVGPDARGPGARVCPGPSACKRTRECCSPPLMGWPRRP